MKKRVARKTKVDQKPKERKIGFKVLTVLLLVITAYLLGAYITPHINERDITRKTFISIAEEVTPSVVFISTNDSSGSGIIMSSNGYIVTNNHVIDTNGTTSDNIRVMTSEKKIYRAEFIGKDVATDLAVIKVNDTGMAAAKLGDSDMLEVGEEVAAIGNPFGYRSTITTGIVSATHRDRGPTIYKDFIQTDANINPGNSGGPLVNLKGEFIGINTFIISSQVSPGLGFAIPINTVKRVSDDLISKGTVERGYVGIQIKDVLELDEQGNGRFYPGAKVTKVEPSTPANLAGMEINDTILKVDNIPIESSNHLKNLVAWISPNTTIVFQVMRDNRTFDINLTLGLRPKNIE